MRTFKGVRGRLSYANVMATLAFFFALTGAATAGVKYLAVGNPAGGDLTGAYPNPTIAAGAVTTSKVADGAITASKIAPGAVSTGALAGKAITTAKIADGAVTNSTLAGESIQSWNIAPNAVDTGSIATGAITSGKIATSAVTTGALAGKAVTTAQIADGAVTNSTLASDSVGSSQIQSGAVGGAQIANGSITGADIDYIRVQSPAPNPELSTATTQSATATCPSGKVLSGGGYKLFGNPDDWNKITVYESQPFTPPGQQATQWIVTATVIAGQAAAMSAGGWEIAAYGICT